ncbi:hypothetical protein [Cyclobacterium sp.]|uniref:hypothetical protein n=1 Tax=Cyclobacterium sp. TaxID=1966343 RepID=UPI001995A113|nr:hypothetical protein [Cyclobacterium sp.]MBD3630492.1 hypothetical protein [Cyclobacterium sp.]
MEILLKLRPAMSLEDFMDKEKKSRKKGLVYFQILEGSSGLITRVVSDQTDKVWLQRMIRKGKIFLQETQTIAETS